MQNLTQMKSTFSSVFFICLLLILGCTNDSESDLLVTEDQETTDPVDDDDSFEATVTFTEDIRPIITQNCLGCHSNPPRNGAPFALVTFEQVRSRSNGVLRTVSLQTGEPDAMPPSGRIPQAAIDLIEQWIEEGLAE